MTAAELARKAFEALCDKKPAKECDQLAAEAAKAYCEEKGLPTDDRFRHLKEYV